MPATRNKRLTDKQIRFCQEYIVDLAPGPAAVRAGFAKGASSRVVACKMLQRPEITDRIQLEMNRRIVRVTADADYVLRRLVEIDQMDWADIMDDECVIKPITEWPPVWRTTLSGIEISELFENTGKVRKIIGTLKKIRGVDKLKNLEMLGKHTKVKAFSENVNHNHKFGDLTDEDLNARIRQLTGG